jgi:hypothetical protein
MREIYEYWMKSATRPWRKFDEQNYGQCFALAMISPAEFEGWCFACVIKMVPIGKENHVEN